MPCVSYAHIWHRRTRRPPRSTPQSGRVSAIRTFPGADRCLPGFLGRFVDDSPTHWARIGREIEGADGVSHRAIADVLAARLDYDGLTAQEQAVVRAEWSERMDARLDGLNLAREFAGEGRSYVELDSKGAVVRREPSPEEPSSTA